MSRERSQQRQNVIYKMDIMPKCKQIGAYECLSLSSLMFKTYCARILCCCVHILVSWWATSSKKEHHDPQHKDPPFTLEVRTWRNEPCHWRTTSYTMVIFQVHLSLELSTWEIVTLPSGACLYALYMKSWWISRGTTTTRYMSFWTKFQPKPYVTSWKLLTSVENQSICLTWLRQNLWVGTKHEVENKIWATYTTLKFHLIRSPNTKI